jgi:type I restriction-modification system DNA methylase subunit
LNNINIFLEKLGFTNFTNLKESEFGIEYVYEVKLNEYLKISIPFLFYNNEESLKKFHLQEWNRNEYNYFIAVKQKGTSLYNAKEKPSSSNENKIENFDYGLDTIGYEDVLESPLRKENIDNSTFFNFVLERQKKIKNEIDTSLLNQLLGVRNKLAKIDTINNANKIMLKCLFVKYLEDRGVLRLLNLPTLESSLKEDVSTVENLFNKIGVINGDILKTNIEIKQEHLPIINTFFKFDYNEKSDFLFFPYQFDKLPIELISNVYESFLGTTDKTTKNNQGVFYTRTFVVDFMLSQKVHKRIDNQPNATILDPACGSGIFLVQSIKKILSVNNNLTIEQKSEILKNQIFGIDIDANALQITAFSLYLALLDSCNNKEIRNQLEIKNPILPNLINYNLIRKNAIADEIEFINIDKKSFHTFDCIVANPPWCQLKVENNIFKDEIIKSKEALKKLSKYKNVSYEQTSQAFLLKIDEFCNENSEIAIIVNNSNFLNDKSVNFRKELLEKYRLDTFFELSNISSILFKGTQHPSAILILDKNNITNNEVNYISPKFTQLSEKLHLISYTEKDVKIAKQSDFIEEDLLWRIFVNGNWKDYQLIKKIELNSSIDSNLLCQRGFEAMAEEKMNYVLEEKMEIELLDLYEMKFFINKKLNTFQWNRKLRRLPLPKKLPKSHFETYIVKRIRNKILLQNYSLELDEFYYPKKNIDFKEKLELENELSSLESSLFSGERIILSRAPDNFLKINAVYTNKHILSKDNTLIFKSQANYFPILSILNSKLTGYLLSNITSQFKTSGRDAIRVSDIENFPFPNFEEKKEICKEIEKKIEEIRLLQEKEKSFIEIENELDELVFDLYDLLDFEKEMIREFFQINVERKNEIVIKTDIHNFIERFRKSYQLFIKDDLRLNAETYISTNIGTIVKFEIVSLNKFNPNIEFKNKEDISKILQLVKEKQLENILLKGSLFEEKVKLYEENTFYLIKSNYFKDWTVFQAMEDANEEFAEMIKKLQ